MRVPLRSSSCVFFFNDTATTEIYTLSLHDALPICDCGARLAEPAGHVAAVRGLHGRADRKSTRLNSSHTVISYAVFCLKKNKHPAAAGKQPMKATELTSLRRGAAANPLRTEADTSY